jgi:hypothetical protein
MLSMEVRAREIIQKIIDKELNLSWKNLKKQNTKETKER